MCGILIVHSKKDKLNLDHCKSALKRLTLRGPDFSFYNIYNDDSLFFGQTVLSITGDPNQHLNTYHLSKSKRYDLVLNGEVYNHGDLNKKYLKKEGISSSTDSDTETLVNLHQLLKPIDIFKKLRGMFAYVVYDNILESLIIGRDIIGEKILYYYEDDRFLILSSEIGPILELVPSIGINKEILKEYFFTRHLLTPSNTTFEKVKLIPPGHLMSYKLRSGKFEILTKIKPGDLIDPDLIDENKSKSSDSLVQELEEVFKNTAKLLAPSIDYYSVFSGGVDSSLISFFMQEYKPPKGFISLQFPGKDKTNTQMKGFEEKLGRNIDTIKVNEDIFSDFFPQCYKVACAPLSTHSFISQAIMSKYIKEKEIKVLIGGDGADELFGGYEFYKTLNDKYSSFPKVNPSAYSGFVSLNAEFQNWSPESLKCAINDKWLEFSKLYNFENDPNEKMLQTVMYADTIIQLESVGIRSSDTMSMVNSVESRSFFLSYEMIRFALNLPAKHKINIQDQKSHMSTKPLLKKLFLKKFGDHLLFDKQGFSGYPNEAAKINLGNKINFLFEHLHLKKSSVKNYKENIALYWKLMNVEYFLKSFSSFLK